MRKKGNVQRKRCNSEEINTQRKMGGKKDEERKK
jgi:hypothetical protein